MQPFIPAVLIALSLALQSAVGSTPAPNTLTAAEKAAGWQLLFDGQSLDAWRGYKRETPPEAGWEIKDGALRTVAKVKGVELITRKKFNDFEFTWGVAGCAGREQRREVSGDRGAPAVAGARVPDDR